MYLSGHNVVGVRARIWHSHSVAPVHCPCHWWVSLCIFLPCISIIRPLDFSCAIAFNTHTCASMEYRYIHRYMGWYGIMYIHKIYTWWVIASPQFCDHEITPILGLKIMMSVKGPQLIYIKVDFTGIFAQHAVAKPLLHVSAKWITGILFNSVTHVYVSWKSMSYTAKHHFIIFRNLALMVVHKNTKECICSSMEYDVDVFACFFQSFILIWLNW